MKPFDPTKPCQTRDGRKVRILCTDAEITYLGKAHPIVGLVEKCQTPDTWDANGKYDSVDQESRFDLINIPEKRKLTGWLVVLEDGNMVHWESRPKNKHSNSTSILDLSKYNIEFTEGEGL